MFSWDIMEPIACCLEALDLVLAYTFWISTNKEFELGDIQDQLMTQRAKKLYLKHGFNVKKYNDTNNILQYLLKKKNILSDNLDHVMEALNYEGQFEKSK